MNRRSFMSLAGLGILAPWPTTQRDLEDGERPWWAEVPTSPAYEHLGGSEAVFAMLVSWPRQRGQGDYSLDFLDYDDPMAKSLSLPARPAEIGVLGDVPYQVGVSFDIAATDHGILIVEFEETASVRVYVERGADRRVVILASASPATSRSHPGTQDALAPVANAGA